MKISRRDSLKSAALAAGGAALGLPFASTALAAAQSPAGAPGQSGPKRFVFFLFSNGFEPGHVRPKDLAGASRSDKLVDVELAPHKLPGHSEPMEKYKDRMTILQGVNGQHCHTSHGSPFGCLAGVRKGSTPKAKTIDFALSQVLAPAPLPMLGVGLASLKTAQSQPIVYSSSASGTAKPVPMFSNPRMLFQNIFGCVAEGKSQDAFAAETDWYNRLIDKSAGLRGRLSGDEAAKFDTYIRGLRQTRKQRAALVARKETLAKFKPKVTDAFDNPQEGGDWWEANIDIGVAALQAGATNVLTIDAGLSCPDSMPMDTLEKLLKAAGSDNKSITSHNLGHQSQTKSPWWMTTRHYTWRLLARIIEPLANTPEPGGKGTMLDNTLIVYTSDAGEKQHSHGIHWPFVLIGNLGGRIRSGRYIQYPTWGKAVSTPNSSSAAPTHKARPGDGRTINALWTTLLHAAGAKADSFNLDKLVPDIDKVGPMENLLA